MKIDDLKGMAVVSVEGAAKLGYIDDILFDTDELRVVAFDLKEEGSQHVFIPFSEVHRIGRDAVTVPSPNSAQAAGSGSPLVKLPRLHDLQKLKVVDEGGDFLGTVAEVTIDTADGRIGSFQAQRGGVFGLGATKTDLTRDAVRSVGPEVMIVAVPPPGAVTEPPQAPRTD